ncbi:hypothetical protein [Candidatus Ichthyocystis sparus]|uniref:hypothetical protein n=1 Tax=Candidatus Ichthyocystis sparus TaxID=1561004 RepID=UPI000B8A0800|nr:hypothetical protein [Candidatus Ichthyocystis sparus]
MGSVNSSGGVSEAALPDKVSKSDNDEEVENRGPLEFVVSTSDIYSPQPMPRGASSAPQPMPRRGAGSSSPMLDGSGASMLRIVRVKQNDVTASRSVAELKNIVVSKQLEGETGDAVRRISNDYLVSVPAGESSPIFRGNSNFEGRRVGVRVKRDNGKVVMVGAPDYDGSSPLEGGILKHLGDESRRSSPKKVRFINDENNGGIADDVDN